MQNNDLHAVTGAFGYTGKYIARRLLDEGRTVLTLTNSPHRRNPFGERVRAVPFNFDDPARLAESLCGVSVLYNTYWVRFNHKNFTHADAVRNTETLFRAAKAAGVGRVVHISITNPSEDSPLEYFSGKGRLERALAESGLPYTILLYVDAAPAGTTKLTDWARERSASLGLHYTSELARRRDREGEYKSN